MNTQYLADILGDDNCAIIDEVLDAVKSSLPESYNLLDVYVLYNNWSHYAETDKTVIDIEAIEVFYADDKGELHTESLKTDLTDVEVECDEDYLDRYSGIMVSALDELL